MAFIMLGIYMVKTYGMESFKSMPDAWFGFIILGMLLDIKIWR